jgi:hypothetical protein
MTYAAPADSRFAKAMQKPSLVDSDGRELVRSEREAGRYPNARSSEKQSCVRGRTLRWPAGFSVAAS